ncbi:MAG: hypothetical protein AUJ92_00725 [Armatimonadetes bacterium CG2_30_59_28]|nr:MAG: hypothetical protein AUJ92_00725 [Armatimonadetes bacterium CG2_30_59_28]
MQNHRACANDTISDCRYLAGNRLISPSFIPTILISLPHQQCADGFTRINNAVAIRVEPSLTCTVG